MENEPTADDVLAGLTERQRRFVDAYVATGNAAEATRLAGFSELGANVTGSQLLAKPNIKLAIANKLERQRQDAQQAAREAGLTIELVMQQTQAIVSFDPRKLFDENKRPLHIKDLDAATAACIGGIEVRDGEVVRYKILDKNVALERAARILGVYEADNSQQNPITALLASLGKSSFPVVR